MKDRERILESLVLDISDGKRPDWDSLEKSLESEEDLRLLGTLRRLALMGEYYRIRRSETESAVSDLPDTPAGSPDGKAPSHRPPEETHGKACAQLQPGDRWEHLEILELIGDGSHGEVYRARDIDLNREVALKLFHDPSVRGGMSAASLLEGERLARIRHRNLVTIHGARSRDGRTGIWMEFLKGPSLREHVEQQGLLGAREAARIGIDLCGALAAIHGAGLLHGDIKAQNVVREAGGRIVLMDLGSGTELPPAGVSHDRHRSGTPLYMAPEVLNGAAATIRSDIYSLGVLLYYAVAGSYPVEAGTLAELLGRHSRHERRHLRDVRPDLPHSFVTAIERAISPDPGRRFAGAGEMEQALAEVVQSAPAPAVQTPSDAGGRRRALRRALPWAGAAIAAAALILAFGQRALTSGAYTVEASLHRGTAAGSEILPAGSMVRPGDRLWLDFRASRDLHVYVLAEDELGESYLLFPLPEHDLGNPVPEGGPHRLPPDRRGIRYSWGVSSAGGREHLLIVASPKALTDFEEKLQSLPLPRDGAPAALRIDPAALEALRGIGALVPEDAAAVHTGGTSPFEAARRLAASEEKTRGVWVRQIDLVNPGP